MTWQPGVKADWVIEANRGERPEYLPAPEPFDAGELIEAATARRRETGGLPDDQSLETVLEPLNVFCLALESEANLTPLGRWATQRYLNRLLDERLALDALATRSEVADEQVAAPIFVIGPPRSGTTVMHRLLSSDPAHRATEGWEVLFPSRARIAHPVEADDDTRAMAAEELGFPQSVAQGIRAIHTYSATMPKECLSAMAFSFRTEEFISRYHVPSYVEWLQAADMSTAYAKHHLVLRVLQSRSTAPHPRWVLKSPVHLQSLPELAAAYPDARLVVTHREPADVLASVSSLIANLRSAFSDTVDAKAVGRYHLDLYGRSLSALDDRLDGLFDPSRVVHVHHADITQDPANVIGFIYDQLGLAMTNDASQAIQAVIANKREDTLGAHRYDTADFGFASDEVEQEFASYRTRFLCADGGSAPAAG